MLGLVLSAQWALARGTYRRAAAPDLKAARAVVLFIFGFLMLMGAARYETILACFGRCSLKLALAAAMAAAVYFGQARLGDDSFWSPARAYAAAAVCALWALFLVLYGLR
ncbi:MAG: hypothetical protein WCK76_06465 [Elusimicrobiota bacterium]